MAKPTAAQFQNTIWAYYKKYGRGDLPWRNTRDPYRILVSEIMLQQTQVSRVLKKYQEFIAAFPNFTALARAPLSHVLKVWQGMGYNRRAVSLSRIAQMVMGEFGGRLPKDPEVLEEMPGIGHYTARAVVCFTGASCEPFLETNIRRVLIHFFHPRGKHVSDQTLLKQAARVEPKTRQRDWYLALMDYGAMLAQKGKNPNRRSKQYRKQSKFQGSNRQLRGMVIKKLVEKRNISAQEFKDARIHRILVSLIKEGFILKRGSAYYLR